MVKFIEVDPDEVPNFRESRRGRVSYPILKSFLETGKVLVMLDRTGVQQSLQSLNSSMGAYIRSHSLPIKLFTRGGQIYLMRTDLNDDGTPNAEHNDINKVPRTNDVVGKAPQDLLQEIDSIPGVDEAEVDNRFKQEEGQVTK